MVELGGCCESRCGSECCSGIRVTWPMGCGVSVGVDGCRVDRSSEWLGDFGVWCGMRVSVDHGLMCEIREVCVLDA